MRDRCNKNDWQHFVGDKSPTVHVRCHGGANVQGREKIIKKKKLIYFSKFTDTFGSIIHL